ncbi:MAG: NADH-quinone oxidoreductase subunit C [Candidatus Hodarchaeales archaeon]
MNTLVDYLEDLIEDAFLISPRNLRLSVRKENIRDVTQKISRLTSHISTITAVECDDGIIELHYHFSILKSNLKNIAGGQKNETSFFFGSETVLVTINTILSLKKLEIASIAPIFPGAQFYEREIREMFGIKIGGIFSSEKLLLADDFPQDVHPLRKSALLDAMIKEHEKTRSIRQQKQNDLRRNPQD